jgi:hypothetical protein
MTVKRAPSHHMAAILICFLAPKPLEVGGEGRAVEEESHLTHCSLLSSPQAPGRRGLPCPSAVLLKAWLAGPHDNPVLAPGQFTCRHEC